MFLFWNRSALRAASTRWCGSLFVLLWRSCSSYSQGLLVPILLYTSSLFTSTLCLRQRGKVRLLSFTPLLKDWKCLTATTLILHFKWGANVSPDRAGGDTALGVASCRLFILVPVCSDKSKEFVSGCSWSIFWRNRPWHSKGKQPWLRMTSEENIWRPEAQNRNSSSKERRGCKRT